ncbi:Crp/Fnr family transcriptional regulator [Stigmatella sp. ncwal1]|uniref:Crp/Fnr family transcriptional regulator n=1 Tax=Stigmatella ashevillensis TaxID=2995309 RepID=A0ABT5DHE3_9BACT|nr:Crp/Fnr family transcriptional regulator [Stigmatella ashevillena]MDC0713084.1 Crp/Fnr family transcriptional regulator [Stigmatella ashevillena]
MSHAPLLARIPLFENLQAEDLEHLSTLLHTRHCAKGDVIFQQGDEGADLYIVRAGQVAIRLHSPEGKEVILTLLGSGEVFGELSLLDGEPRSTHAVAREETTLLSLRREDFHRFLDTRPQVARSLLATLSRLVRRVTQHVHDATFLDARTRLVRVLLDLSRNQGEPRAQGVAIRQRLTQSELANLCGLTRESTNKWLRFYVREGMLSYEAGQITLLKPELFLREQG